MPKSKSSKRWLKEHFSDNYVKNAKQEGYRSRAAYKLLEIQDKYHLICDGMIVIDLGAAPGSWSEVATKIVGPIGKVIAMDILQIEPIKNVKFICGDISDLKVIAKLSQEIGENSADLVMSDMAPNTSGIKSIDQAKSMHLAELAFDFAKMVLKNNGNFLIKIFQNNNILQFIQYLRQNFVTVKIHKPKASRSRSAEIYLVALKYKGEKI